MNKRATGFSILELSISLTVIALVIAAVTAGTQLKEKYELDRVMEDMSAISLAIKEFQKTYNAIPGDMFNAEDAFGVNNTDNGNGNGIIGTAEGTGTNKNEQLLCWQHLALAGLINGTYDGSTGAGGKMKGPLKNSYYTCIRDTTANFIISLSNSDGTPLLTTKQAYYFDTKFDDGIPTSGKIFSYDGSGYAAETCRTTTVTPNTYNLTNTTGTPCYISFYIQK